MLKQIDSSETTAGGSGWWVEAEANRARHDWNEVSDRPETPSQKERVGVCFRPRTDGGGTSGHCSDPPALGTHPARVCRLPDDSAAATAYRRPPGQCGALLEGRRPARPSHTANPVT